MKKSEVEVIQEHINRCYELLPEYFYRHHVVFDIRGTVSENPIPFGQIGEREWAEFSEGQQWGENWHSGWFHLSGTVPPEWEGQEVVALLNFGGEALVVSAEGEPLQGLTGSSAHLKPFVRDRYRLFDPCAGGEDVNLYLEAAANELFGVRDPAKGDPVPMPMKQTPEVGQLKYARLCTFDEQMYQLWLDMTCLIRLMNDLPERDPWRARILHTLHDAVNRFRHDEFNAQQVRREIAPLLQTGSSDAQLTTRAVGHAHIDTAWLWPMRETVRKCARTFSTQLQLLDKYPDYVFGASQAQHYAFVKDNYPRLYERIKKAVAEERWEIQGAMWVEADCNVTSGESLVRQVLYGKRFFREEFGVDVTNLWLPDVFGYSAALPQILRQAGVDTLVTQKMSWNQCNKFPHHTFRWTGIDGTPVTVHFPPEDNYNAQLFPDRLRYAARNYEQRGTVPEFLTLFGIGDGGGGPTETHIELGRRQEDLAGVPNVDNGPAGPWLDELDQKAEDLPEWVGELYLELHRGTLTTQAANKRFNRRLELYLRRMEILYSTREPDQYPREQLRECWRSLLTNQFHDIIPGSSISRVYEDTDRDYARLQENLHGLEEKFLEQNTEQTEEDTVTLFNSLSHHYSGPVHLPEHDEGTLEMPDGTVHPIQPHPDGGGVARVNLDGLSAQHCRIKPDDMFTDVSQRVNADTEVVENELIRYTFDQSGRLTSVYDKIVDREFLRTDQPAGELCLYQDWPANWDAWDVDRPYRDQLMETASLEETRVVTDGPSMAALRMRFCIGESEITQTVSLTKQSRRLDFRTEVTWNETRKMLRVRFPVDVDTDRSISEIQFGAFERPTHDNTSWERAQFEVCAHRFADLSEPSHGVALLNDCKYGHYLKGNVLDLNLLRSPCYPDREADRGHHRFTYALLPHEGPFMDSEVVAEAHALNQPPVVFPGRVDCEPGISVESDSVVVDTMKRAEDGDQLILRLYESKGSRDECEIDFASGAQLREASIMEEPGDRIALSGTRARLSFSPFEIKTLMVG